MYNKPIDYLEVIVAFFHGYCLQFFYGSFLQCRMKNRTRQNITVTVLFALYRLCSSCFFSSLYNNLTGDYVLRLIKLALTLCFLLALAVIFYKPSKMTIYLGITFLSVSEICLFLAHIVLYALGAVFPIWSWLVENGYITSVDTAVTGINLTSFTILAIALIMSVLLVYIFLKVLIKNFRQKNYALSSTELAFIIIPSMIGLFVCIFLRITVISFENNILSTLYDKYPPLLPIIPTILLLCLCSVLYSVKLFNDMIYLNTERNGKIILQNQIEAMQEHITEMEHIYSEIRSIKHDMKNTLSIINRLSTQNSELQAYLSELNETMDSLEFKFKTGNTVVDTLLNMKYNEICRIDDNIKMEAENLLFPAALSVQSYDIGVILGNALDNAIDACKALKEEEPNANAFIRIYSFWKGKMFFIEIENSFDGRVTRSDITDFPITTKNDKNSHGIGFHNISNAAEKYYGGIDWSVKENVFTLTVMLKNETEIKGSNII